MKTEESGWKRGTLCVYVCFRERERERGIRKRKNKSRPIKPLVSPEKRVWNISCSITLCGFSTTMSFSGTRRGSTVYSSMVVLLIIFLVLQIWALNSDCCRVTAIRTSLSPPPPPLSSSSSSSKDADEIKRSELYKRFFSGRFARLNSTTVLKDKSFQENKRRVPSCPDPLHN